MINYRGNLRLQRAVRFALTGATLATLGVANAQTPPAEEQPSSSQPAVQEVVVTGSRIALEANSVAISPVLSISADEVQQTGVTRIEDMLNTLPQVNAAQGTGQSNGADGTAQVNFAASPVVDLRRAILTDPDKRNISDGLS